MLIEYQFVINASQPASDKIFDVSAFEKFLHDRIKVEGRVGNLGDKINISQSGDGKVEVVAHIPFSGRYLKYLYVPPPPLQKTVNRERIETNVNCSTGPRSSSRSSSSVTGCASSPPPRVSTSSASTTSSTTRVRRMRSKLLLFHTRCAKKDDKSTIMIRARLLF